MDKPVKGLIGPYSNTGIQDTLGQETESSLHAGQIMRHIRSSDGLHNRHIAVMYMHAA